MSVVILPSALKPNVRNSVISRTILFRLSCALLSAGLFFPAFSTAATSITVQPLQSLSFGNVAAGSSKTILVSDAANAGEYLIVVTPSSKGDYNVELAFGSPAILTTGRSTLTVSFGSNSAAWNTTNSLSGSTTFNPSTPYTIQTRFKGSITLYVWISGSVSPGPGQQTGNYSGPITLSVTSTHTTGGGAGSADLTGSATVIQGLSLTAYGTLNFGSIIAGTTPSPLSAQTNGAAPLFLALGAGGYAVAVSYSQSIPMYDAQHNQITFLPSVFGSGSFFGQTSSTAVNSGSAVTLSDFFGEGLYFFWLGGTLDPIPGNQSPGVYSGTFTLTVTYTN